MSKMPSDNLPPLLILAAPAGITTVWMLPHYEGWSARDSAVAALVVFVAVLCLPHLAGWFVSGAKKAAKAKKKAKKNSDK